MGYRSCVKLSVVVVALALTLWAERPVHAVDHGASWIFDQGEYTNDPKSGQRTWQYEAAKPVYRDPNAVWDSTSGSFPFVSGDGDPFLFMGPYSYFGIVSSYQPDLYDPPTAPYHAYGL
jgi:hypothetical protein